MGRVPPGGARAGRLGGARAPRPFRGGGGGGPAGGAGGGPLGGPGPPARGFSARGGPRRDVEAALGLGPRGGPRVRGREVGRARLGYPPVAPPPAAERCVG